MYLILVGVQAILLLYLVLLSRTHGKGILAVVAFRPINWIILFYFLAFIMPQIFIYTSGMTVLGLENLSSGILADALPEIQFYLICGLISFILGFILPGKIYFLVGKNSIQPIKITTGAIIWIILCFIIGTLCVVYLQLEQVASIDGMRSGLVKTLPGKIAYAFSFLFSFATLVLLTYAFVKKKYVYAVLLCGIVFVLLLPLGGRGRVLWPILEAVLFILIYYNVSIKPFKMGLLLAVLFVILQSLDPINFMIQGYDQQYVYDYFINSLDISKLFMERTFEGFHNYALIVYNDFIPHNIGYLFGGSGQAFMIQYFPREYAFGVGYPATFFGELWLVGGVAAIIIGSCGLGLLFNFIERLYFNKRNNFIFMLCYLNAIPWLSLIGGAYFDQMAKVLASILCSVLISIFIKRNMNNG